MAKQTLSQLQPNSNVQTPVKSFPQLLQLRRHDPASAASAERLLAAGFPDAAAHRVRQGMHNLMDRLIQARKATRQEVSHV